MKYVKLTAKPDTWYKAGTEAYDYDCHPAKGDFRRISLSVWEESWLPYNMVLVRGLRIADPSYPWEQDIAGQEYWDGESCSISEFDVEIVDEPR